MNHAQKYLAQANRHIAELTVQIARQRAIVKDAFDTGQRSEMAESLLDALEGSLRIFEKHRIFLLSCNGSFSALPPGDAATDRSCHETGCRPRLPELGISQGQPSQPQPDHRRTSEDAQDNVQSVGNTPQLPQNGAQFLVLLAGRREQ